MKINNGLGVFAPTRVRRRKGTSRRPPWYVEVPPDTVDIALLPRINRYERGGLRFRRFGSTQQKFNDRLALFRDAMGEIEPGIGFTEEHFRAPLNRSWGQLKVTDRHRAATTVSTKRQRRIGRTFTGPLTGDRVFKSIPKKRRNAPQFIAAIGHATDRGCSIAERSKPAYGCQHDQ